MQNFEQFIKDLSLLVSFNGVKGERVDDMPFGKQTQKTLESFDAIAKRMGFETVNHDNYLLEFSYGQGEEIGIIGHLDVVPVGNGWNTDPFTLTEKDGVYYARGVHDDKGPTLLALYALKEVIDSGLKFNRKIRFFAGTNEESGWEDIDHYIKKGGTFPEYGFSPDGDFPLSYAEKGIFPTTFYFDNLKMFENLNGGQVLNAVCDYATVKPLFTPNKDDLDRFGLSFDGELIISKGVAAHGSTPELGVNALKAIFEYMLFMGENVKDILDKLFYLNHEIFNQETPQGKLTLSPNKALQDQNGIKILCDVRAPAPFTFEQVTKAFESFGYKLEMSESHPPMCVEKDGWFVKALLSSYNTVMQEDAQPISMGGSTYARAFKKGCAFGAGFPNHNNGAHEANESFSKQEMLKCFEIYKLAIENLVK